MRTDKELLTILIRNYEITDKRKSRKNYDSE
jgi:hypothetical protein